MMDFVGDGNNPDSKRRSCISPPSTQSLRYSGLMYGWHGDVEVF